ncbi:MAG TPA: hypothetical protein ENN25_00540 [Euryarchaeota archaeon]|nr:hypothetical protein [Euryarchaeota archaeon]
MSAFSDRFLIREPSTMISEEGKKKIHDSALELMETVGIRIHSKTARAALKKAGASVDESSMVVKFPKNVVEDLRKKIPRSMVLSGRTKEYDLPVDGSHHYYTTDGCGIFVWDEKKQSRRQSLLEDITKTAIIGDHLPYLSIYEPMVVAHDIPEKIHVLKGMKEAFENTSKHIETESTTTPEEARAQIKMASEIMGGVEELRKRHLISAMVCTMSPFILEGPSTEAAMIWAENHVPVHITGMAEMGISGPATIAGDLTVNHAETLALACAMQAHEPGSPLLYGSVLSSMDPRTGGYTGGSPESMILGAASAEMARFCNIPNSCGGIGSSARIPGLHASIENSHMAAVAAMTGSEVMNGLGVVDGSTLLSYEQLMLDHEIAGITLKTYKKIEVNNDTVPLDLIKKVGIGGTYLNQMHTLKHIREFHIPFLWSTEGYDSWVSKGKKDLMEEAKQKSDWILKNHEPKKLDGDISKSLDKIIKEF